MATKNCISTLGANIMNDCNEAYGQNVEKCYYVISRDAIDWGISARDGNIITDIIAVEGKRGYKIMYPSNNIPAITVEPQETPVGRQYIKKIPFVLLANSPENAAAVDQLHDDKYVIIYEQTDKGADGKQAFVVVGWENGAFGMSNLDKSSEDSQGGWSTTMTESRAKTAGIFFFKTDYATSKAALESLCSDAV